MQKKANKTDTVFESTIAALDTARSTNPNLTILMNQLNDCKTDAKINCGTTSVPACQSDFKTCQTTLEEWVREFKRSCVNTPGDNVDCACTNLTHLSTCLSFDNSIADFKAKCTNGSVVGTFGYCRGLQLQAAERGSGVCAKGAVEESITEFFEDGKTLAQENRYNPLTGVLTLIVPPHKNYTENTFVLLPETGQQMLSASGECLLSDLKVNVTQMNEGMKTKRAFNDVYTIQIRESILSDSERQNLSTELRDLCGNSPIIKTVDKTISKKEFEDLSNETAAVLIDSGSTLREGECKSKNICTKIGPNACGFGFPYPAGGGFSAHQLSNGVLCVSCCVGDCTDKSGCPDKCLCKDITDKSKLMDCILGNETPYLTYQDPNDSWVKQSMKFFTLSSISNKYNPSWTRALEFSIPAHDNYKDFTLLMKNRYDGMWHVNGKVSENNMLMKIGDTCHILNLPAMVFPMDLGVNFIQQNQARVYKEEQFIQYSSLTIQYSLTDTDKIKVHPDIKEICSGHKLVKSERVLRDTEPKTTIGCIRWPEIKLKGKKIATHEIVSLTEFTGCLVEDGIDYFGNDIKLINNTGGVEACANWCGKTPKCKYWSMVKPNTDCFLKNSDEKRIPNKDRISGTKGCTSGCLVEDGIDYFGNDIELISNTGGEKACANLCGQIPECKYWSMVKPNTDCFLKNSDENRIPNKERISGIKVCTSELIDGTCYEDSPKRLLPYRADMTKETVTPDECKKTCGNKGYTYAGVEYSIECWCGNGQPSSLLIREPRGNNVLFPSNEQCSYHCTGNSSLICGGFWRINIYKTESTATTSRYKNFIKGNYYN